MTRALSSRTTQEGSLLPASKAQEGAELGQDDVFVCQIWEYENPDRSMYSIMYSIHRNEACRANFVKKERKDASNRVRQFHVTLTPVRHYPIAIKDRAFLGLPPSQEIGTDAFWFYDDPPEPL